MDRNFHPANSPFLEELYESWLENHESVPPDWQEYFQTINGATTQITKAHPRQAKAYPRQASADRARDSADRVGQDLAFKQGRVDSLIWAYRDVGYLYANLNPLEGYRTPDLEYSKKTIRGIYETLDPKAFGLSEEDMEVEFSSGAYLKPERAQLRTIIQSLKETYCSYIGAEILHIQNRPIRRWLIEKIETDKNKPRWNLEEKREILEDLVNTEELEHFIHSHYIGQKRFSLEGAEVLIPALHYIVNIAAHTGIQEIVLGMAHRGRLDVLSQILGKPVEEIFVTFEDNYKSHDYGGSGDVKYHLGCSLDHVNEDGSSTHISLVANPSHLESVDPVVEGKTRAVQDRIGDVNRKKVIPILIHGDAAFTGQGVVAETFNLSQTRGYRTGGTLHIIINNQIGFTTASQDARSTFFPTDMAKIMHVPIFHVNGDQPEHVIRAIDLAFQFRQKFGYDAVVDILCYRQFGHNEADEPSFTHPIMYKAIKGHPSVTKLYGEKLEREREVSKDQREAIRKDYRQRLQELLEKAKKGISGDILNDAYQTGEWKEFTSFHSFDSVKTGFPETDLKRIARALTEVPDSFNIHPKLKRIVSARATRMQKGEGIDWATAEALSFGSLLLEGTPIRLSGEDSGRGTFSQRHAVWWDSSAEKPNPHIPLNHIAAKQARFSVYDSPLSEFSILGFEYGYALNQPKTLTLWEAQFGDFANGAQVIIDNFLASGESKWFRSNGLVMLLPHGFEGQGPEHSSAHLERYLQLCAEHNLQVSYPSTPAQYFHLLRRQMHRPYRKPLIVMTPKSLLRHALATSTLEDLVKGTFREVLWDPQRGATKASKLILCSGKVFYDLWQRREKGTHKTASAASTASAAGALIRIEQLYPFPEKEIKEILHTYSEAKEVLWVQEEPQNRGAWSFVQPRIEALLGRKVLRYVGRNASASPATGSHAQHQAELELILENVFGKVKVKS